ncbi:hypothetical protein SAMN04489752_0477 [Brevibacterium siliguriense]|uniref:Uncharacterized protein n=1 Tax=Brevibacterium siliguriense TaxID=1136497 RepID=A0A1H1MNH0_9MICO|nr:hypothetical protein SAMN04489752_0477 [Brevibacterium siliguriense]
MRCSLIFHAPHTETKTVTRRLPVPPGWLLLIARR